MGLCTFNSTNLLDRAYKYIITQNRRLGIFRIVKDNKIQFRNIKNSLLLLRKCKIFFCE